MRWWMSRNLANTGEIFDDGVPEVTPGCDGFSRDIVEGEITRRGPEWSADYMGPTDGLSPAE